MSKDKRYVPGDFYRIDDRTGFKTRAYDTVKEWTGRIVRKRSWEPRQPQDFVKGVRDDQAVPDPRPRSTDIFIAIASTARILILDGNDTGDGFQSTPIAGGQFKVYNGNNQVLAANFPRGW